MSIRPITLPNGKIPYSLIEGAPPANPTLTDVLTNGNTTGGIDILGASSNIETDALKCVSIRPLAFPVQTDIIIDGNLAMEDNTNIDFGTDVDIQIDNQQVIYTDGSTNVIFSNVPRTSVAPSIGDDLCNKTYVDAQVTSAGIVDSVVAGTGISVNSSDPINPIVSNTGVLENTAGSGISITGTKANYTIANSGVLDNTAGSGISITGTKANYTIANSGVLDATAGSGISITGTKANYTIANDGVLNNTAGSGITITGTKADYTIANSGVLDATAGSGISITGTKANYTIANSGVLDNTAGSGISITGTKANYTIANNGVLDLTAGTAISITGTKSNYTINAVIPAQTTPSLAQVMDISSVASKNLLMNSNDITGVNDLTGNTATFNDLFCSPVTNSQISLNKTVVSSQQLIKNTYYVNDNVVDIQTIYDDHATEQGIVFKISSGSYGGSTLTINNSANQFFECPDAGNGSTITELASGRGLTITNSSRIRFSALQIEGAFSINGKHSSVAGTNCIFSNCEFLGASNIGSVVNNISGFITFYQCAFTGALNIQPGTATIYFINCDFGNQVISNTGSPAQVIISNAARLNTLSQTAFLGVGTLASNAGVTQISTNELTTPLNTGSITSRQIEVASDPGTSNALTRKSYVDAQVATKVGSVTAGTAISVSGTATAPIINNTGVTSLVAGSNITLSGSTGAVTISATGGGGGGVNSITAGTGISIAGTSTNPIISNSGIITVTAGTGLSSTQVTPGNPTLNNEGVLELTAGAGIQITGTKANYTITNTGGGGGGGGVNSIVAGRAITVDSTNPSAPIVSQSRFIPYRTTFNAPTVGLLTSGYNAYNLGGYDQIEANPNTGTIIMSGLPGSSTTVLTQRTVWRSTDGGLTWSVPFENWTQNGTIGSSQCWQDGKVGAQVFNPGRMWFVNGCFYIADRSTSGRRLVRSSDDGLNWISITTPEPTANNIVSDMVGDGSNTILAVMGGTARVNGVKIFSLNNGITWQEDPGAANAVNPGPVTWGSVVLTSCAYGNDPVLGNIWVVGSTAAASISHRVCYALGLSNSANTNWKTAWTETTGGAWTTFAPSKVAYIKNKWFFVGTADFQPTLPATLPPNQGAFPSTTSNPGCRGFFSDSLAVTDSGLGATFQYMPYMNPFNLMFMGNSTPGWMKWNPAGEIFAVNPASQNTGYKAIYQRADQDGVFQTIETINTVESSLGITISHDFSYTGTRWIGVYGNRTTRVGGAFLISCPTVLP